MSNMDWALGTAYNIAATPEGRHVALDVAGMAPFVGGAADALNAGLYACEGDYANAALSGAAIVFDGIGIAKLAGRVTKGASKATNKLSDTASTMRHHAGECLDGVHCFTEGTQIVVGMGLAEDGMVLYDTKNIEDIEVGDLVYSYDTATGEYEYKEVTDTFVRRSDHINYLTIQDEYGNEQVIETTDGHPFWVVSDEPELSRAARSVIDESGVWLYHENVTPTDNGYWVEAKDLRVGDVFLGADGRLSTLTNIVLVEQNGGIDVFNFSVEGNHNYFVLAKNFDFGQSCVLVHNSCWSTARQNFWKNEAISNTAAYSKTNIALMRKGLAPRMVVTVENNKTGIHSIIDVSMELHHLLPQHAGGTHALNNLVVVSPWAHSLLDPFRHTGPTLVSVIRGVNKY